MRHVAIEIAVLLFILAVTPVWAGDIAKEYSERVPLDKNGVLSFETYKGSIELTPWSKNEVDIHARIIAPDDVDDTYGEKIVAATNVVVTTTKSRVIIKSDYDEVPDQKGTQGKTLPYVHYTVSAPDHIKIKIKDYKSKISFAGFTGDLDLETYKGGLDIQDHRGDAEIETYKSTGSLAVAGSLELETYKGKLDVTMLELAGSTSIETYKGRITLNLDAKQGFNLQADLGRKGNLDSDFEVTVKPGSTQSMSVNGGGPEIQFETYKGSLNLKQM